MARTITVELVGYVPPKVRPAFIRALGLRLHPESITDAWYKADCPPRFRPREHGVSWTDTALWRVTCVLRGCR